MLQAEPALARVTSSDGTTPLWWLPDEDAKALEIATLLMAHGADRSARSKDGETAADSALERGMVEVARLLAVDGAPAAPRRRSTRLQPFEDLAQALVFAYETGHPASMQRLQEHTRTSFTWDELRADVRARLAALGEGERPDGYFALPHARLLIARQAGNENWDALTKACS